MDIYDIHSNQAAEALGKIENYKEIQPLKNALKDEGDFSRDEEKGKIKDAAFEALYKISRRLGVRILKSRKGRR